MNLSKHFTFNELTDSAKHPELVESNRAEATKQPILDSLVNLANNVLQPIRDAWGPILVNSGYRSIALNKAIGGSKTSDHRKGLAADITAGSDTSNRELFNLIISMIEKKQLIVGQLILEVPPNSRNWIHISTQTKTNTNEVLIYDGKKYTPVTIKEN